MLELGREFENLDIGVDADGLEHGLDVDRRVAHVGDLPVGLDNNALAVVARLLEELLCFVRIVLGTGFLDWTVKPACRGY